jgi:cytochrome P450
MISEARQAGTESCPLADIDAQVGELLLNPYDYYSRLRSEAPVFRDPRTGIVSVSTYELVLSVNKQPKVFSSEMTHLLKSGGAGRIDPEEAAIMAQGLPWVNTMLTADPPLHTRYKKIAMNAFTVPRVQAMTDYITETVHRLIDGFAAGGKVEFKKAFADQLPSIIIADLLGVPRSDIPQFQTWLRSVLVRVTSTDREERIAAAKHEIELQQYMLRMIADCRRAPRDNVISDLVHATLAEEGDPRPLEDAELMGIIHQLFTAGQETTAHALTYALYQMIQLPDQIAQAKSDPSLFANFIEEVLRHLSPTQNMWRIVKQDVELGGVSLNAGDVLLLRYGSANRDENKFADSASFDMTRANAKEHLAFGAGIHTCLGMALARREMQIAIPILLDRLPGLRLVQGTDIRLAANILLRGVQSLNIEFDPA